MFNIRKYVARPLQLQLPGILHANYCCSEATSISLLTIYATVGYLSMDRQYMEYSVFLAPRRHGQFRVKGHLDYLFFLFLITYSFHSETVGFELEGLTCRGPSQKPTQYACFVLVNMVDGHEFFLHIGYAKHCVCCVMRYTLQFSQA